jgi:cysteine-rich repeat protein
MSIAPGTGLAPLSVVASPSFQSWAAIQSMDWLDGTVNTSTGHTYVTTGSFLATLTIENQFNATITNTCSDLVQVSTECGNNILEIGEECDDGITNGVACSPPYAGNCTYCSLTCRDTVVA